MFITPRHAAGSKVSFGKAEVLLLAACLMSTPPICTLPASAQAATDTTATAGQADSRSQVMKALLSLRFTAGQGQSIIKEIDQVNRYLEDTMIQVSYPVLIPAAETNPLTLATPNPELYSGHFKEQRSKPVMAAIEKIGQELTLLGKYLNSIYIPDDKKQAVQPLLNDITSTFGACQSNFALVQKASAGTKIDAEVIAVKLSNIQKDLTTVDNDLKSVFQIINLQDASQDTMSSIANMRMLGRDAHWLGLTAKYLHDNARELNPDAAIIQDAQDQNWLVFGTPEGGYKGLNKNPYEPLRKSTMNERMTELSQYVTAVSNDIKALKTADAPSSVRSLASQMQTQMSTIQDSYENLQSLTSTANVDPAAIAKEVDRIGKVTQTIQLLGDKVASKLLQGKTII